MNQIFWPQYMTGDKEYERKHLKFDGIECSDLFINHQSQYMFID